MFALHVCEGHSFKYCHNIFADINEISKVQVLHNILVKILMGFTQCKSGSVISRERTSCHTAAEEDWWGAQTLYFEYFMCWRKNTNEHSARPQYSLWTNFCVSKTFVTLLTTLIMALLLYYCM